MNGRATSFTEKRADDPLSSAALRALENFIGSNTHDDLWDVMVTYATDIGADLLSYHHHAPHFAPDHGNVSVRIHGFPNAWVEKYRSSKLHLTDPITQIFATRMRPMKWSEVDSLVQLTPAQTEYLESLRDWMTGDGVGIPVFGPSGRSGYVGLGCSHTSFENWGRVQYHRAHWVAESFHIRWCELVLMSLPHDFTLDRKEVRILESLSRGVQDEVICGLVGAQLDSVRQSIRKIMRKMGVSDRPSAILRGIGAGLIEPKTAPTR